VLLTYYEVTRSRNIKWGHVKWIVSAMRSFYHINSGELLANPNKEKYLKTGNIHAYSIVGKYAKDRNYRLIHTLMNCMTR